MALPIRSTARHLHQDSSLWFECSRSSPLRARIRPQEVDRLQEAKNERQNNSWGKQRALDVLFTRTTNVFVPQVDSIL